MTDRPYDILDAIRDEERKEYLRRTRWLPRRGILRDREDGVLRPGTTDEHTGKMGGTEE